uniref:Uncharacterized protein n=1 Tax=Meloidogyne floridensis TaxID=298350 RepID=A0A915NHW3_9BILA
MFLNTLSKTFIVFIFAGFAPFLVKGMRNALDYHEEFNQKYGKRSRIAEERRRAMARRLTFINKRLGAYKQLVNGEEYTQFIQNYDLNVDEFGVQHDFINNPIPNSLKSIRSQIALFSYILLFDDYELSANSLHDKLLIQFHAFDWFARYGDDSQQSIILIKDLRNDEKDLELGYPVFCVFEPNVQEIYPLIHQFIKPTSSPEITTEEFAQFEPFRIQGDGIPNNTYNLYQLVNSEYVVGQVPIQGKLHQYYINPQLIAQIRYQMDNDALVYNDQLIATIQIREGVSIPPQIRGLYIQYPPPEPAGSGGEGGQQAAGTSGEGGQQAAGTSGEGGQQGAGSSGEGSQQVAGRRRQRDGDGNGGNGGNGQRGRGRQRRNGGRGRNGRRGGNGDGGN